MNIFDIKVEECQERKNDKDDWVGKCWMLISKSLHNELFVKVAHVQAGNIPALLDEIRMSLLINMTSDAQAIKMELYSCTMASCGNDLQTFIANLKQKQARLTFLKEKVGDKEMVAILLKGLHPIFQPLQVYFSIPGSIPANIDDATVIIRKFASTPIVQMELNRMKTGTNSQAVFNVSTPRNKGVCKHYMTKGSCSYGDKCKFQHLNGNNGGSKSNGNTSGNGNTSSGNGGPKNNGINSTFCKRCKSKHPFGECKLRAAAQETTLIIAEEPPNKLDDTEEADVEDGRSGVMQNYELYMLTISETVLTSVAQKRKTEWLLDSGATVSATYNEKDCFEVQNCNIQVKAAGVSFEVYKKGKARITTLDEQGNLCTLLLRECLISDKFPYKLLSLQTFTKQGFTIIMQGTEMLIKTPDQYTIKTTKDIDSNLYFLPSRNERALMLAQTYSQCNAGSKQLWNLHLQLGHRNFQELSKTYHIPISKIPACTSCIMGKSHVQPHFDGDTPRASRKAEGFHSDFRGPFSIPTPSGESYLLTITDDYSKRIFAYLVKSQTEWFDIWKNFVTRIEAELGRPNCIAWLLTDNGMVYKSLAMTTFCKQKGIVQRFATPYGQWQNGVAERNMRSIGEMTLTTLIHANLPRKCWGWASLLSCEILNRTISKSKSKTRLELWHGKDLPHQTAAHPGRAAHQTAR